MINYVADHILEILAIIVAFVIFYLQIRKKTLSYIVLTNTSLVSISDKLKGEVKVLYQDEPVSNVQLIELKIKNTGNVPIKPDDYIEPLKIMYPVTSNPLTIDIVDQQHLGVTVIPELSNVAWTTLSKTLLNPKDSFIVKLLNAEGSNVLIHGRIVGVPKIQNLTLRNKNKRVPILTILLGVFMLVLILILQTVGLLGDSFGKFPATLLTLLVALCGFIAAGLLLRDVEF